MNDMKKIEGREYYTLIMRCPACIANGKSGGIPGQWYHHNCGGKIWVGDDAFYYCETCSSRTHVKNWTYWCPEHSPGQFLGTGSSHIANAISTSGQITSIAGRQWLMRFLENLGDW